MDNCNHTEVILGNDKKKEDKTPKLSLREQALLSEKDKKFDKSATKEKCIKDLRRVQKDAEFGYISRNYYRANGKYSDSTWHQFFGTFLEFRRQAGLELLRDQHLLERQTAKHASLDIYREYYHEEILPYHKKYPKKSLKDSYIREIMVGSDFHDLLCDRFALSVWNDQLSRRQPDIIAFNGDVFDCPEFSKFPFDPRKWQIKERFQFVKKYIFAEARRRCPNAQIDFIIGNHEWRILKLLALQSPNVRILLSDVMGLSLNDVFGLDDFKINLICKVDLEAFKEKDMKDEMQNNYEVYYDAYVLCHKKNFGFGMSGSNGHLHTTEYESDANLPMGNISWMQTPCMHMLDAEYIEGKNNWNMGFGDVFINILTKEVIQTPINIHQDWTVIDGKVYRRGTHG